MSIPEGEDYSVEEDSLSITFPAGEPMEVCVNATIIDDDTPLEEDEDFTFVLADLPEGVEPGDQPNSTVTIADDDGCKNNNKIATA